MKELVRIKAANAANYPNLLVYVAALRLGSSQNANKNPMLSVKVISRGATSVL
jgi:hypothetical protein